MPVKIVLADDHRIVRNGLRLIIEREPDMTIAGEAENGRDAIALIRKLRPDLVLMDISMPDMNGIEATRKIKASDPDVRVLALSMHADRRYVMEMLKAGASGYILKSAAADELINAIRAVMAGHKYLCHIIADKVIKDYMSLMDRENMSAFSLLTPREREVLQLIAEGMSTKQIASRLNISVKTVETYRQLLMEKLDLHSVAELTLYAVREGLVSLED